jgi:NUMOD1 domain
LYTLALNAIKEAARNFSIPHSEETKLKMSINSSNSHVYIYDEFRRLLVIVPSLTWLTRDLNRSSTNPSIKIAIKDEAIFRSSWYISLKPFNEGEKPLMVLPSPEYSDLIEKMKSQKHIRKAIFVFKEDGEFIKKYDGIKEVEKALNISYLTIKSNIEKNTTYKGYKFSYHRVK